MKQLSRFYTGLIAGLFWIISNQVNAQIATPWPVTYLDSVASVTMPYAGTLHDEMTAQGLVMYSSPTSDNQYDAVAFTPTSGPVLKPGQVLVPDPAKFLAALMKVADRLFSQPKLQSKHPVTLPTAPGSQAMHYVYSGFDKFHQLPAQMEVTWVVIGSTMYVFRCSYALPQEPDGKMDVEHFLNTIRFKLP